MSTPKAPSHERVKWLVWVREDQSIAARVYAQTSYYAKIAAAKLMVRAGHASYHGSQLCSKLDTP